MVYPKEEYFQSIASARVRIPGVTERDLHEIVDQDWAMYPKDDGSVQKRRPRVSVSRPTTVAGRRAAVTHGKHRGVVYFPLTELDPNGRKSVHVMALNRTRRDGQGPIHGYTTHCYESVAGFHQDFAQLNATTPAIISCYSDKSKTRLWSYLVAYDPLLVFDTNDSGAVDIDPELTATLKHTVRHGLRARPDWHTAVQSDDEWQEPRSVIGVPLPPVSRRCDEISASKPSSTGVRASQGAEDLPRANLRAADGDLRREWYN